MTRSIRALPLLASLFAAAPALAQAPTPLPPPPPPPVDAAAPAPAAPAAPVAPAAPGAPMAAPAALPPAPPAAPAANGPELTTLQVLHEKGVLSDKELESAVKDLSESTGEKHALESNTVVMGKWATTLYGFAEADYILDSTQSFNDLAGNGSVAAPGSYAGEQGRTQFSIRNSRIGFRMKAPEYNGIRTSAQAEMDFLGTQLPVNSTTSGAATMSEAGFFSNPTFRVRHMNLKVETPIVDVLFGQYWELYGWQSVYHPNTVDLQGVPGQIYSRNMQLRISKTIKTDAITFEAAVAALRPVQRNSEIPKGQAGLRLAVNNWTGVTTAGGTGTSIQPLSLAVTGEAVAVRLPSYFAATENAQDQSQGKTGTAIAIDAFVPVLPAKKRQGNALALNGEFSTGYGNADVYTGLNGGAPAAVPQAIPATAANANPKQFGQDLDTGIAMYDSKGNIHMVQWTSYLFGLQYTLPGLDGKAWVSGNYSHLQSGNLGNGFLRDAKGNPSPGYLAASDWFDVNLMGDITPSVRLGLEYANFNTMNGSGIHAINHRGQFSAWYIF